MSAAGGSSGEMGSSGGPAKPASLFLPYCHEISKYEKLAKIGQGTFGEVFKARDRKTQCVVALKKVRMENEKEGFPMTALRELRILQLLKHDNIVNLIEICRTKPTPYNREKGSIYLVFEFCEHDLAGLLRNEEVRFALPAIKTIMQQLFTALHHCQVNNILHRDVKSSNVLITKSGILKMADYGLARAMSPRTQRYTNRVVTLWYRAPELILGERNYGPPIDQWGAGCIMCELWVRHAVMQGDTEQHQLNKIVQFCGSITPEVWPGVERLELYSKLELPRDQKRKIRDRMEHYVKDHYSLDLIDKLLVLDPRRRITSSAALDHDFFWEDPEPSVENLALTLSKLKTSMFEMHTGGRRPPHPHQPPHHGPMASGAFHDRVF